MGAERRLAMVNSDAKSQPPLPDPEGICTRLYDLRYRTLARTPYDHLFTELATLDAVEAAVADGCDALYLDTFGDYGIERARSSVAVPVIGAGEASIAAAAASTDRFSIVTVWPRSMAYLYEERLATCPGGDRCVDVHHVTDEEELERVGTAVGVKARMLRREDALVAQLVDRCRRAVDQDRSDAVLLGCTCMTPVTDRLAAELEVPVLDPSRIGLGAAFQQLTSGSPPPPPPAAPRRTGLATAFIDAYLAAKGIEQEATDECDVCLVTPP